MITKHSLSRNVGLEEVELFFLYTVNKYASPIFKLLPALETLEIWLFLIYIRYLVLASLSITEV